MPARVDRVDPLAGPCRAPRSGEADSQSQGQKEGQGRRIARRRAVRQGRTSIRADKAELEALPGVGPSASPKRSSPAARGNRSKTSNRSRGLGKARIDALREPGHRRARPPAAPRQAAKTAVAKKRRQDQGHAQDRDPEREKVNINTASKEELDALPGIGPVKAQAIIEGRPFKTIEDIMKVKGIKDGEFSKIKDMITVK